MTSGTPFASAPPRALRLDCVSWSWHTPHAVSTSCHCSGKGASAQRQSDSLEVARTCSWKPGLLHGACADGPRPGPRPALWARQTLPRHRGTLVWLMFPWETAAGAGRTSREAAGEVAGCRRPGGRLGPLAGRGPRHSRCPVRGQRRALSCAVLGRGAHHGPAGPCSLLPRGPTRAPRPQACHGRAWKGCRTPRGRPCERGRRRQAPSSRTETEGLEPEVSGEREALSTRGRSAAADRGSTAAGYTRLPALSSQEAPKGQRVP